MKWIYMPHFRQYKMWPSSSGGRWGAVVRWECSFWKISITQRLRTTADWWDGCIWKEKKPTGKRNGLRGKSSALVSAGIVRKPVQVRALSGADHLASVSNGFNTRCWETRCVGQHVTSSLNLDNCAFVSSTRAVVHEAVQKGNQSTGSTGLFNLLSSNLQVLWLTDYYLDYSSFLRQKVQVFKCFGERGRKFSGSSLPPFSFRYWTVLTFSLPSTAAACKIEKRSMNLDNSTLGYFTEFRQFHFNSGLGYITYVRLYHHAGNDIH